VAPEPGGGVADRDGDVVAVAGVAVVVDFFEAGDGAGAEEGE
jgi:hypothetical protein